MWFHLSRCSYKDPKPPTSKSEPAPILPPYFGFDLDLCVEPECSCEDRRAVSGGFF
jgi:hypothetical protein